MRIPRRYAQFVSIFLATSFLTINISAQMITGVWKGKINRQKVEIKVIQNGDSLIGTSYYYESANTYRRYSLIGYFDSKTNEAVWWDDKLLDEKSGRFSVMIPGKIPMLSRADFNCPGSGKMMLDGNAVKKDETDQITGTVHLDKIPAPFFEDEWDFVINNYTVGANDRDIIDSIGNLSQLSKIIIEDPVKPIPEEKKLVIIPAIEKPAPKTEPVNEKTQPVIQTVEPAKSATIEEKFTSRIKTFIKEIPVSGDSIELRFYDNAEIDGDSISLFLNDKLLFQHIRLTGNAYIIKIAVSDLHETNELIMVAENMGAIPPNTSYMIAIVNNKRYDAYLASTEGSSAMIRFVK